MDKLNVCAKVCKDCPFSVNSLSGWLGPYADANELHQYVMLFEKFPCHLAQKSEKITDTGNENNPICKGSIIYMNNVCKLPRNPEIKKLVNDVTESEKVQVLDLKSFHEHHRYNF